MREQRNRHTNTETNTHSDMHTHTHTQKIIQSAKIKRYKEKRND